MNQQTLSAGNDPGTLAEEARALMAATADVAGDEVEAVRKRLAAALESATPIYAYPAISIALGVGALIGYVAARRSHRND